MEEALRKACMDIRLQQERLHKAVDAGCYEEVHCIVKGISDSCFDACHAACCCEPEPAKAKGK